jgi:D-alanyl-lipoteichoic acid acyltransferase DltB (MBOAT superfamily)
VRQHADKAAAPGTTSRAVVLFFKKSRSSSPMLFNTPLFLFAFLPLTRLGFGAANQLGMGAAWLVAASLVFYAAWNPLFLLLLLPSIGLNFAAGLAIERTRRGVWLGAAVAANLAVLGWFKYAHFFAGALGGVTAVRFDVGASVLPLGISFFTFEQIGYLVDVRRGAAAERDLVRYALFVAFFPRLVAGPILRFSELMPQVPAGGRMRATQMDLAVGMSMFAMGLAKKSLLADGIAPYASAVFGAADHGAVLGATAAWGGALAYTLQLYFDFSGYSDMAIGAARLFGLRFPANFNSPYKSTNIVEFWRRWHMTLSRFLRDYLYIALGGNRHGQARRYANLLATMVLGGLWHGANWTFVAWGALHGGYLIANHAWHALERRSARLTQAAGTVGGRLGAWALTMLAVMVGWVFFRAHDFASAWRMLGAMSGVEAGGVRPVSDAGDMWAWAACLSAIALLAPNSQQILSAWAPVLEQVPPPAGWPRWRPTLGWGVATACVALAGFLSISQGGEFLYWKF